MSAGAHQSHRARLLDSREIGPQTRHLLFEMAGEESFSFVPGQFVSLIAQINGREFTRAYSMASPPEGNRFELCLNLVPEGHFSAYLFALQPGAEVQAKGPYGAFIFRQPADTICVATGTGIAPFRGMLRKRLAEDPAHQYTLIFGARYERGLLYHEELKQFARENRNFRLVATVTRPDEEWQGCTGRVQAHVLEAVGERRDLAVYLCGMKEMVEDVRDRLRELGFDRKQIVIEKYD